MSRGSDHRAVSSTNGRKGALAVNLLADLFVAILLCSARQLRLPRFYLEIASRTLRSERAGELRSQTAVLIGCYGVPVRSVAKIRVGMSGAPMSRCSAGGSHLRIQVGGGNAHQLHRPPGYR